MTTETTRYGFCGLAGVAPLALLPFGLAGLKIRCRRARWTRSEPRENMSHREN